ncbi:MAG: aldo/keto reductase [Puniceicoccaceae bacterium]
MSKRTDRRNFLKSLAISGAAVTSVSAATEPKKKMRVPRRKLGETGARTSILGLGLGSMFWKPFGDKPDEAVEILMKAFSHGINYWDTARNYDNSELLVGPAAEKVREKIFLVSKSGSRDYDGFMRDLETSLKSLRTDHLDLYHLHSMEPKKDTDMDMIGKGAVRAALKAKDEGMIKNFGFTGHSGPAILIECIERWNPDVVMSTYPADRPDDGKYEDELLPVAKKHKVGMIAMKSVRYARNTDWPAAQLVRYPMSLPGITTTIVGLDSIAHLEENVAMASNFTPMKKEEMASFSSTVKSELATMGDAPWMHPEYEDGVSSKRWV